MPNDVYSVNVSFEFTDLPLPEDPRGWEAVSEIEGYIQDIIEELPETQKVKVKVTPKEIYAGDRVYKTALP